MSLSLRAGAIGLAAGAVLGFVLGISLRPSSAPAPGEPAAATAAAPASATSTVHASDAPTATAVLAAAMPAPSTASAIAAAVAAAAKPEAAPAGTGKITGRVKTAAGAPVAGAKVTLLRVENRQRWRGRGRRSSSAAEEEKPIESLVKEWVASEVERRASKREAVSDASGAFAFAGLGDGRFYASARAEGFKISGESDLEPGADVELTATALGRVEATLVLPDGSAPPQATILFSKGNGGDNVEWSPDDPVAEVAPGTYTVSAWTQSDDGDDATTLRSTPQHVVVEASGPPARLTFELKGKPAIHGAVVLPADEKSPEATVFALRFTGPPPDASDLVMGAQGVQYGRVNARGSKPRYEVTDLQPGSYLVGIGRGYQGPVVASQIVEVADGPVTVDLALPPADRASAIDLTVLGAGGERLDEFTVSQEVEMNGMPMGSNNPAVVHMKDGTTLVFLAAADPRMAAAMRVRFGRSADPDEAAAEAKPVLVVAAEGLGERRVTIEKGQHAVTVRFAASATLDVTIAGYAKSGLEGRITPSLVPADAKPQDQRQLMMSRMRGRRGMRGGGEDGGIVDADGRASLGPVEAGSYEIVLTAASDPRTAGFGMGSEVARTPVELRAGKNAASVAIPALYTLEVDAPPGSQLSLRPDRGGEDPFSYMNASSAQVNKAGRGTFELLPAGRYVLNGQTAEGEGGEMTVAVPASGVVKFAPETHDAYAVTITSPTGGYAKLGLEDGDLVVAIEGTELDGDEQMQGAFMSIFGKEAATLTLLRGGTRVDLVVDPKKLRGGTNDGGYMRPVHRPR
jgi:hypothetical protein